MNKKGFTLIEMLVVIAIIAVLVSIVIPVVGNATDKAKAATDAANLRAVQAEVTTAILTGTGTTIETAHTEITIGTDTDGKTTYTIDASAAPVSATNGAEMDVSYSETAGAVATYKVDGADKGVSYFADKAK